MSASTWGDRPKRRAAPVDHAAQAGGWVGLDFSGPRPARRTRGMIPLLLIASVVALGVAALRIDLIRIRYAMAEVTEAEDRLREERRQLIARKRQLRDPVALAELARVRGFRAPSVSLTLPDPAAAAPVAASPERAAKPLPSSLSAGRAASTLPAPVSAAPGGAEQ